VTRNEEVAGELISCWQRGCRGELAGREALRIHYKAFSSVSETATVTDAINLLEPEFYI